MTTIIETNTTNETTNITQTTKPLLCLNMIVKNEASIIKQTLEKLVTNAPIDYWVISDTGSTDGTQDIIKSFFNEKGISGELYEDEWKDFGYNRTKALEYAFNKSKFLLVFDADDSLNEKLIMPDENDEFNGYYLRLLKGLIEYTRVLLIKNNTKWNFKGVLHEYINCEEPGGSKICQLPTKVHVSTSGSRSNDPEKYSKDAKILEEAYFKAITDNDGISNRYAFYCANSYFWANIKEKAKQWFKIVLQSECWVQEKFMSCLNIFSICQSSNNIEEGIYYLIEAYKYDKSRPECISRLVDLYNAKGEYKIAYNFYNLIKDNFEKEYDQEHLFASRLFTDTTIYHFFLPYSIIISANNTGNHETAIKMFKIIFKMKINVFSNFHIRALLYNLTLYEKELNENNELIELLNQYLSFLRKHGIKYNEYDIINRFDKFNKVYL